MSKLKYDLDSMGDEYDRAKCTYGKVGLASAALMASETDFARFFLSDSNVADEEDEE